MDERRPHAQLADTPWPAEDGGPERLGSPWGLAGPDARSAELVAVRHDPICVMALLGSGDEVLVLRNDLGPEASCWVESIDPESLAVRHRSEDLALGPFWPGGMAILADGAVVVVQGNHAHRLGADLSLEASRALPVVAPYNSFVVLADGTLATKDLERPDGPDSTLLLLDPVTLEDRAAPVSLGEPSVARLSAAGNDLVVVGTSATSRFRWDPIQAELEPVAEHPYLHFAEQSFGWDPVLCEGEIWWMDNGDHTFEQAFAMVGQGVAEGPVRLWRADPDGELSSVEVSGEAQGAITNPPLVDPDRGIVVAYDSANAIAAGFSMDDLSLLWRRPLATSQHLVLFSDTGEVLANDFHPERGDALVVLDVADGSIRARADVESPAQSVVFGAPGRARDAYYVSLSTIARVAFGD